MQLLIYALSISTLFVHGINGFNETSGDGDSVGDGDGVGVGVGDGDGDSVDNIDTNGNRIDNLALPEAQHNISSILCIIKFCEKYFRSEKAVIGSLVIVNVQNTTEFHSELITMLNEHANYDLGVMTKDATKPHFPPVHVVDKAKNYFVVFNRTSEVGDAINQW